MASLTASVAKGKILSGARMIFSMQAQNIGWATGVRWNEAYQYERTTVLGNIEIFEDVPVGYTVDFSLSSFRIVGITLRSMGLMPKLGANPDEHLNNLLTMGALTATVEDTKTNIVVASFVDVRVQTSGVGADSRGLVAEDVGCIARRCINESEAA